MTTSNQRGPSSIQTATVGTVAELFAGVGGFRIGLARAGLETVFSNQWEPSTKAQHASSVYVANFGPEGHSNQDIATLASIPVEYDVLVGGFPCQDYSVAKSLCSATGLEGKKGVLWWEILRLVRESKPKFIFLENVDRLLKSPSKQRGRDFAVMLKTLGDEGYFVEWRVVNSADYGFPQRRKRVFIVAYFIPKSSSQDLAKVVTKSGVLGESLPVYPELNNSMEFELNNDLVQISEKFNVGGKLSPFRSAGVFNNGRVFTADAKGSFQGKRTVLRDVLQPDSEIPAEFWIADERLEEWRYLKGAKSLERVHASGATYKYSEGQMAFPDSLDNPSRTILTGEGGTSPSRFKHIIKTERGYRRLTPLELERLNGFPDNWTLLGEDNEQMSDVRRAFFMGNALVVGVVEMVGRTLAKRLKAAR